jgi:putative aldouronate transport system substrate-binding protein
MSKRNLAAVAVLFVLLAAGLYAEGTKDASAAQPAGPIQIEMWLGKAVTEAGDPPADWELYRIAKEKFNIDLKISFLPSTLGDMDVKINTAAAANMLPDFFLVNRETWVKLAKAGLLGKTESMLPLMPTRTQQFMSEPIDKTVVSYKNVLLGLSTPGAMPRVEGLVIRKDWLDKLGLKVPTTLDELFAVAKAFTEKDPDGNGKNDTYGLGGYVEPTTPQLGLGPRFDWIFGAYGAAGTWDLRAASFGLNVRKPDYPKGLDFVAKLATAGYLDPDFANIKKDEFRARWKQGRFGIMWEQFAALASQSNYAPFDKNFPNGEWIAINPPKGPAGLSANGIDVANYRIYAVSTKAEKEGKLAALAKLLEWMSTEGYYMIGWGKEGVNYNKGADGVPNGDGIAKENHYSNAPVTQLRNLVFYNSPIELAARYPTYKTANGRTLGPLMYWEAFKKTAYTACWGASLIDPPANAADFTRFYNENIVKFAVGQQPLTAWADFLAGLDKLGAVQYEAAQKAKLDDLGLLQ